MENLTTIFSKPDEGQGWKNKLENYKYSMIGNILLDILWLAVLFLMDTPIRRLFGIITKTLPMIYKYPIDWFGTFATLLMFTISSLVAYYNFRFWYNLKLDMEGGLSIIKGKMVSRPKIHAGGSYTIRLEGVPKDFIVDWSASNILRKGDIVKLTYAPRSQLVKLWCIKDVS